MYYLQSRYYDPTICRFINCDDVNYIGITKTELSYNPFVYCENNPVNGYDPSGNLSGILSGYKNIISIMTLFVSLALALSILWAIAAGSAATFNPVGWIIAGGIVIVGVGTIIFINKTGKYNFQLEMSKRTKIPSKLKNKDGKVKTPDTDKNEFDKKRGSDDYVHKKTKWKFHKDKGGHFKGDHWDVTPPKGKS